MNYSNYNNKRHDDEYYAERRAERKMRRAEERERQERRQALGKRVGTVALAALLTVGGGTLIKNVYENSREVEPTGQHAITVAQGDTAWGYAEEAQRSISKYNETHPDKQIEGNYSMDVIKQDMVEANKDNPDVESIGQLDPGDTFIIPDYTPNDEG